MRIRGRRFGGGIFLVRKKLLQFAGLDRLPFMARSLNILMQSPGFKALIKRPPAGVPDQDRLLFLRRFAVFLLKLFQEFDRRDIGLGLFLQAA